MPSDGGHNAGSQLRERLARLEVLIPEVSGVRLKLHELSTHVAILIDASERAESAHTQLALDIRATRDDADRREQRIMAAISQHDRRDDDRFDSVGVRLNTLEREMDVAESDITASRSRETRWFERRTVIRAAWVGLVATVGGALIGSVFERLMGTNH